MTDHTRKLVIIGCIVLGVLGLVLSYIFAPDRTGKPRAQTTPPAAASQAPPSTPAASVR